MTCNACIHFGLCRLENETPARCQHFMPNIVHCRDCKYFSFGNLPDPWDGFCMITLCGTDAKSFCSDGEKP